MVVESAVIPGQYPAEHVRRVEVWASASIDGETHERMSPMLDDDGEVFAPIMINVLGGTVDGAATVRSLSDEHGRTVHRAHIRLWFEPSEPLDLGDSFLSKQAERWNNVTSELDSAFADASWSVSAIFGLETAAEPTVVELPIALDARTTKSFSEIRGLRLVQLTSDRSSELYSVVVDQQPRGLSLQVASTMRSNVSSGILAKAMREGWRIARFAVPSLPEAE